MRTAAVVVGGSARHYRGRAERLSLWAWVGNRHPSAAVDAVPFVFVFVVIFVVLVVVFIIRCGSV